jgi:E3 ubiquitin-protein ligase TRIP12
VERSSKRISKAATDAAQGSAASPAGPVGSNPTATKTEEMSLPAAGALAKEAAAQAKKLAEAQMEEKVALLKSRPDLSGKFIKAIVPVLVDVYAASVAPRVRTKVLTALVKAAAFAEPDQLHATLKVGVSTVHLCYANPADCPYG